MPVEAKRCVTQMHHAGGAHWDGLSRSGGDPVPRLTMPLEPFIGYAPGDPRSHRVV